MQGVVEMQEEVARSPRRIAYGGEGMLSGPGQVDGVGWQGLVLLAVRLG